MSSTVKPPAGAAGPLSLSSSTVWSASWLIVLLGCISPVSGAITSQMSIRVVETQFGRLRGTLVSIADPTSTGQPARRVEVYRGLQYASLLGGKLRFMPPTGPMEKWDGVHVALKHRPVCPQPAPDLNEPGLSDRELARRKRLATFVENQQEDCLTLNIYVPARGQRRFTALRVVSCRPTRFMFVASVICIDSIRHFGTGSHWRFVIILTRSSAVAERHRALRVI